MNFTHSSLVLLIQVFPSMSSFWFKVFKNKREKYPNSYPSSFTCLRIAKKEYCDRNSRKWAHKRALCLMLPKYFYVNLKRQKQKSPSDFEWNHGGKNDRADFSGVAEKMNAFSFYFLPETREMVIQGLVDTCILSQEAMCVIPMACRLPFLQYLNLLSCLHILRYSFFWFN